MRRVIPISFALMLALGAPAAFAGGWATAGLSSTPAGVAPGEEWKVDVTIMQHGRTPLEGVKPAVIVRGAGGAEQRFPARPTAKPGVYRAEVVFPRAGRYTYTVDDGFTNAVPHEFPPVQIAAAAPAAPAGSGSGWWPYAVGGACLLLLAAAGLRRARRRSPLPA